MTKRSIFIVFIVMLQLFNEMSSVDCRPEAKKGKGTAFGTGILAGGLAGAAVGHLLTRQNAPAEVHHIHYVQDGNAVPAASNTVVSPPAPIPSTVIKKEDTLPNGCYKQFVKEPDVHDVTRFVETEMLVCPPNVPPPPIYIPQVPVQPVMPVVEPPPQPLMTSLPVPTPSAVSEQPSNAPFVPAAAFVPQSPTPSDTPQSHGIAPFVPIAPQQLPQPVQPVIPPYVPQSPTPSDTPQSHGVAPLVPIAPQQLPQPVQPVISPVAPPAFAGSVLVLSKTTGSYEEDKMKKNAGDSLLAVHFSLMLLIAGILYCI